MYGRGVSDYGRAYSQEGDYINRLASLSQTGQTAVNTGINAGATYTSNAGNALQAAGNAQAAGIVGQTNAYTNTLANLSQAGGYAMQQYQMRNPTPYADPWVSNDPSVWG
jgi:fumarate hydratase class II